MQLSALLPMLNAVGELTMAEKGISSAKVILTGFVVVFAVLLLLIIIIKIYSAIVNKAQSTGFKVKKKVETPGKPEESVTKAEPVKEQSVQTQTDGIPGEVIAVISAAVATMYGGKDKVRIKSVKKSGSKRSAWANAGVIENTRPF
ncbi:MAG: OadG family transporter subunit [Oscillospiraceae bacterium]|nr:OadG family transporter subunit [Oscillospiraceae bacterium]